jgi:DNA-directed RNA polymerase subunit RPC12/RpoP
MKKEKDRPNRMLKDEDRPNRMAKPEPPSPEPEPEQPKTYQPGEIRKNECHYCGGKIETFKTISSKQVSQHPIEYVIWKKQRCLGCNRRFTVQDRVLRNIEQTPDLAQ